MQNLLTTPEDIQWLRDTHLKRVRVTGRTPPVPDRIGAAMIFGNEDCPTEITLYDDADPRYDAVPLVRYTYDGDTDTYGVI